MSQGNDCSGDLLAVLRGMWGNMGLNLPGMGVPTFDSEELEKRISDLKVVEGWLSMNLSMLQMTIRSLEMQNTTLRTVRAMGEMASTVADKVADKVAEGARVTPEGSAEGVAQEPGQEPKVWPLMFMQQIQEIMQRQAEAAAQAKEKIKVATGRGGRSRKTAKPSTPR